jgi:hypothetical protein
MKNTGIRIALAVIEVLIGLSALGGGIAILTGMFDQWLPLAWLQGTPFSDYTIPGLLLLIVVGGGMLLAAATAFIQREWTLLLSMVMGLVMIGFEIFEVAIIDRFEQAVVPTTLMQQILMSGLGLVICGLSASLWIKEYRGEHVPMRHAHHV